jgi:hypothetical protein
MCPSNFRQELHDERRRKQIADVRNARAEDERRNKKSRRGGTLGGIPPRRLTRLTGPPAWPGCPSASHPTILIRKLHGTLNKASRARSSEAIVRAGVENASGLSPGARCPPTRIMAPKSLKSQPGVFSVLNALKRFLVGQPLRTSQAVHERLTKRVALVSQVTRRWAAIRQPPVVPPRTQVLTGSEARRPRKRRPLLRRSRY